MRICCWLLCAALVCFTSGISLAGPRINVTRLDGNSLQGELLSLDADRLRVATDDGEQSIPVDQLMEVSFSATATAVQGPLVTLADGSEIQTQTCRSDGTETTLTSPVLGEIRLAVRQVAAIRLAAADERVAATWTELCQRNSRDDLLVFRKGDVLDYSAGSLGKITDESVTILIRGRELAAPIARVFGVIYSAQGPVNPERRILVRTSAGDSLVASSLVVTGGLLELQTLLAGRLNIPLSQVESLDYGGGRIRFLADLPLDHADSRPPGEPDSVVWFLSRNAPAGSGGKAPLRIGGVDYRRGLWLHSGAVIRFRLNREFTRFKSTAGFDLTHVTEMPRFAPRVKLIVQGDGKELFTREFAWDDPPVPLDIDIADVRELSVRIESLGKHQGVLEHFALGDAQVIQ